MTTTFHLHDDTKLDPGVAQAYVAGWINAGTSSFQVLQSNGTFGGSSPTTIPFYLVSSVPTVTLDSPDMGGNRLVFLVSPTPPAALGVANGQAPIQYAQYPYQGPPGAAGAPGPFDIFEFGLGGQDDVSAVSGFGLNLRFALSGSRSQRFGVSPLVSRRQIGAAYKAFILRESGPAHVFAQLFYDKALPGTGAPPPLVGNQFFAIADPNDMLDALTFNYSKPTSNPLATYWDTTLATFFADGNYLSINLSAGTPTNIYSGQCSGGIYTLSNGTNTYTFANPLNVNPLGFAGGQYVFMQQSPGAAADQATLQDNIWMALCRGVAQKGVRTTSISNGESTAAWNVWANWYPSNSTCHYYAKFLHCSDVDGNDSRTSGKPPIFIANAAYGFGEDENPAGPYSGPTVPSKSVNVGDGASLSVSIGPWDTTGD